MKRVWRVGLGAAFVGVLGLVGCGAPEAGRDEHGRAPPPGFEEVEGDVDENVDGSDPAPPGTGGTLSLTPEPLRGYFPQKPYPPREEEDHKGDTKHCWTFETEKDISFILVDIPCPKWVKHISVTDLNNPGRKISPSRSIEPSNCQPNVYGIKFEGVDTRKAKVCVEAREPIDRDAVTIVVKAATVCEIAVKGEGTCN